MTTDKMRLSRIPVLTMVCIGIKPEPKTIALGGVATGSMKAHDAASVAGISTSIGSIALDSAAAANMGSISCVVAVLVVFSV